MTSNSDKHGHKHDNTIAVISKSLSIKFRTTLRLEELKKSYLSNIVTFMMISCGMMI